MSGEEKDDRQPGHHSGNQSPGKLNWKISAEVRSKKKKNLGEWNMYRFIFYMAIMVISYREC